MTLVKSNIFEGGSDGTTITTGNSGGASGDAWAQVDIGTGCTCEFDSARASHGTLSGRFAAGGTAAAVTTRWSFTDAPDMYSRFYLYLASTATIANRLLLFETSGFSNTGRFEIVDSTGPKLKIWREGDGASATGTVNMTRDAWVRIETRILLHASAGIVEAKLFNTPGSSTPDDTITLSGIANTNTNHGRCRFGWNNNVATREYWLDSIALDNAAYLGPFVPPGGAAVAWEMGVA